MKISANDLIGPALNWVVRTAISNGRPPVDYVEARDNFSTCFNKAGPLLMQCGIATRQHSSGIWYAMRSKDLGDKEGARWTKYTFDAPNKGVSRQQRFEGPGMLTAGLRALVAYKLGVIVDVPDAIIALSNIEPYSIIKSK